MIRAASAVTPVLLGAAVVFQLLDHRAAAAVFLGATAGWGLRGLVLFRELLAVRRDLDNLRRNHEESLAGLITDVNDMERRVKWAEQRSEANLS